MSHAGGERKGIRLKAVPVRRKSSILHASTCSL